MFTIRKYREPIICFMILLFLNSFVHAQITPDFQVTQSGWLPSIGVFNNGNVAITYTNTEKDSLWFCLFDSVLNIKQESTFIFSPNKAWKHYFQNVSLVITNNTVFQIWEEASLVDVFTTDVYGNFLSDEGHAITDTLLISPPNWFKTHRAGPDLEAIDDTTFVCTWFGDYNYLDSTINSGYMQISGQFFTGPPGERKETRLFSDDTASVPSNSQPHVAYNTINSTLGVVWRNNSTDSEQVRFRVFSAQGVPLYASKNIIEDQSFVNVWYPRIKPSSNGGFLIAFSGFKDGAWGIYLQKLTANMGLDGDLLKLNDNEVDEYASVEMAQAPNGLYVVIWEGDQDGSMRITGLRLDTQGIPMGLPFIISHQPANIAHYFPKIAVSNTKIYTIWSAYPELWANVVDWQNPTGIKPENINEILVPHKMTISSYPNPFNPSTDIILKVPLNAHTTLRLFDTTGRLVKTILSERLQSGEHVLHIEGTGLSNGVYYCVARQGTNTAVIKLVYIK